MTEASVVTQELRSLLGVEVGPNVYEIERGMIKKFAEAIDDDNPLWQDEDYAKQARYGNIVTPPTFLACLRLDELLDQQMAAECSLTRFLDGGKELEYFQPITVGDIISVSGKVVDLEEREGKRGKMLFIVSELIYKNQRGEIVAKARNILVRY